MVEIYNFDKQIIDGKENEVEEAYRREIEELTRRKTELQKKLDRRAQIRQTVKDSMAQSIEKYGDFRGVSVIFGDDEAAIEYFRNLTLDLQPVGGAHISVVDENSHKLPATAQYFLTDSTHLWTVKITTIPPGQNTAREQYGIIGQFPKR